VSVRLGRWLPGVHAARHYRRSDVRGDLGAGIVLAALLIPQGMAYAELAGLPPVTGLYTTVAALVVYGLLGPSRVLVPGPDSALSPLVFAAVVPLAAGDTDPGTRLALAGMLAVLLGAVCIAAGAFRLGVIADLLSMPMRVGFLDGIAVVVLVGQLPRLFGFTTDADGVVDGVREFVRGVADGRTRPAALLIGLGALAVIAGVRRIDPRLPGILLAAVGATLVVVLLDPAGVPVVGAVPEGLPVPTWPGVPVDDLGPLLVAAIGLAFITVADTTALSRSFADGDRPPDPDREMVAMGAANVAAGLVQGFPLSASVSRTAVARAAGARTQLAGLVGAVGIVVVLVAAPGLTADVPTAVLAAIVTAAACTLFDARSLVRLWRVRRSEFALAVVTAAGVVFVGVLPGIAIAAALSVANFVRRAWRPYNVALGRIEGRKGYHDVERHPEARQIPGLLLFRFDAPLFFANARYFADRVEELVATRGEPVRTVVVAAEPISDVDTTAADVLVGLVTRLRARGTDVGFAECKGPVKDRLRRYGLGPTLGEDAFWPTLGTAVDAYLRRSGVPWVDWEDDREDGEDGEDREDGSDREDPDA
jgi:high affinity sulfate transporter 1